MAWSDRQQYRLGIEKDLLDKYFKDRVTWYNPTSYNANVEIKMTSNSDRSYILRVYLNHDFPNSCPQMSLVSPESPWLKNGDPLPHFSYSFYTIGMRDGHIQICHSNPHEWTADNTLFQVFMKGRLWIAAYEGHLDTGENIDVYLKHQTDRSSSELSEAETTEDEMSEAEMSEAEMSEAEMHEEEELPKDKKKCVVM